MGRLLISQELIKGWAPGRYEVHEDLGTHVGSSYDERRGRHVATITVGTGPLDDYIELTIPGWDYEPNDVIITKSNAFSLRAQHVP